MKRWETMLQMAIVVIAGIITGLILYGCSERFTPKTEASMLAWRLAHPDCARACPLGQLLQPVEPQSEHITEDCCNDPYGLSWASCAWNIEGRFLTREQLMRPSRYAGDCGSPGFPDCERKVTQ